MPEKNNVDHAKEELRKSEQRAEAQAKQFRREAKATSGVEKEKLKEHARAMDKIAEKARATREKYKDL